MFLATGSKLCKATSIKAHFLLPQKRQSGATLPLLRGSPGIFVA